MLVLFVKKLGIVTIFDRGLNFFILIIIVVEVTCKFILNPSSVESAFDSLENCENCVNNLKIRSLLFQGIHKRRK